MGHESRQKWRVSADLSVERCRFTYLCVRQPYVWMRAAPSGTVPRVCVGIVANARAQAPLRTLQSANCLLGRPRQGRGPPAARAQSGSRHATRQARPWRSAAPRVAAATARHRRHSAPSPVCPPHASCCERLLERVGRDRGGVACESEAGLVAFSTITLPAITSKCRSSCRCRLRTYPPSSPTTISAGFFVVVAFGRTTASPTRMVLLRTVLAFAASSSKAAKLFGSPDPWQGQVSKRRIRIGTSPNSERNVAV
jgi:hypothetical protein